MKNLKTKVKEIVKRKEQGITLIALIVTIIVLLILAGVTIATLTGDNGVLTKTQQAKDENENASDRDKISMAVSEAQIGNNGYQELNSNNLQEAIDNQFNERDVVVSDNGDGTFTVSCLDTLKDYKITANGIKEGIDWNEAMANAIAPESQDEPRNEGVIGIGTDGNPVDMDLWEYTKLDDGTYVLNDEESLIESGARTAGYIGKTIDGKIEGTIPQYIKDETSGSFIEVTNLESLFRDTNLIEAPKIPSTVTSLSRTFQYCSQLIKTPIIPNGVINMYGTFAQCSSLMEPPEIPITVTSLSRTFLDCTSLIEAPTIPSGVIDMTMAFQNCSKLTNSPEIPVGVVNMEQTFYLCSSLITIPSIPNTVKNLTSTFQGCFSLENITITIHNSVEKMTRIFNNCPKLCGTITIYASISDIEDEKYILANSNLSENTTEELEVLCPEEIYNKYYDENRVNKLNVDIFGYGSSNVKLTKIY